MKWGMEGWDGCTTFMRQKVRSLWQSEVQTIFMRASWALGGATSTSSIWSGSPAALLTAAVGSNIKRRELDIKKKRFRALKGEQKECLCIGLALGSSPPSLSTSLSRPTTPRTGHSEPTFRRVPSYIEEEGDFFFYYFFILMVSEAIGEVGQQDE